MNWNGTGANSLRRNSAITSKKKAGLSTSPAPLRWSASRVGFELKTPSNRFAAVNINVPVDGAVGEVQFLKKDTP
jgi:hypothetical protein